MAGVAGKASNMKRPAKTAMKSKKSSNDEHKRYEALNDVFKCVSTKKTPKSEKSEKIDHFIKNFLHTNNTLYLKRYFLFTIKFCVKYGSESQRDSLQEFFREHLESFLISTVVGRTVKAFFYYGTKKRRQEFLDILGSRIPKLVVSNNVGAVLEEVFKESLTPELRYKFIEYFFGQPFRIFKASYPTKSWKDFACEKEFDSTVEILKDHMRLFMSKEHYGSNIFHYLLLKLLQLNKGKFLSEFVPMLRELLFENSEVLKTHYSCLMVALILLFHYDKKDPFKLDDAAVESLSSVVNEGIDSLFLHSGGCILAYALCHFESFRENLRIKLLQPFGENPSYYLGNEEGRYNNFMNFLDLLSFKNVKANAGYPLLKILSDSDFKLDNFGNFKNVNDLMDGYRKTILPILSDHFSKNSLYILLDLGYGHLYSNWRYLISEKVVNQIYSDIHMQLTTDCSDDENYWLHCQKVSKIAFSIMNCEHRLVNAGLTDEQSTLQHLLENTISLKEKVSWATQKTGYQLLVSFLKHCKNPEIKLKLTAVIEEQKKQLS